jgi:hypothetical protein
MSLRKPIKTFFLSVSLLYEMKPPWKRGCSTISSITMPHKLGIWIFLFFLFYFFIMNLDYITQLDFYLVHIIYFIYIYIYIYIYFTRIIGRDTAIWRCQVLQLCRQAQWLVILSVGINPNWYNIITLMNNLSCQNTSKKRIIY